MAAVRVLIVDDHPVLRAGTRQILEQHADIRVVADTGAGADALALAATLHPDVAIVDMRLPDIDGLTVTRRIRADCLETQVLILSAYDDQDYVVSAMRAGAVGYVLKTVPPAELVAAVRAAKLGQPVLHPEAAQQLAFHWVRSQRRQQAGAAGEVFTEREAAVLRLVARGLHNKEIADELHLSVRTVESHIQSIFRKAGVSSRTEAAMAAASRGLVQLRGSARDGGMP